MSCPMPPPPRARVTTAHARAAWNKCLTHLLALARAHVDSVMFERFLAAVNECPDPDCRKLLKARAARGLAAQQFAVPCRPA